jgi:hypothetical protein
MAGKEAVLQEQAKVGECFALPRVRWREAALIAILPPQSIALPPFLGRGRCLCLRSRRSTSLGANDRAGLWCDGTVVFARIERLHCFLLPFAWHPPRNVCMCTGCAMQRGKARWRCSIRRAPNRRGSSFFS